jgi:uncharacterized protein YgiM (DUF1202 family)
MATHKGKTWLYVTVGLLAAGGVFAYMKMRKKKGEPIDNIDAANMLEKQSETLNEKVATVTKSASTGISRLTSQTASAITSALSATPVIGGIFGAASPYARKTVSTQSTSLNIREKPDATSKVIGTLRKGATILVRPSNVYGWYDYSEDGKTLSGYVSMNYIK